MVKLNFYTCLLKAPKKNGFIVLHILKNSNIFEINSFIKYRKGVYKVYTSHLVKDYK